ncbi:unnamed protein product, partial [Clonostachys rhizophaga]
QVNIHCSPLVTLGFAAFALCDLTQASLFPSSGIEGKPTTINDFGGCINIFENDDAQVILRPRICSHSNSNVEREFFESEDCEHPLESLKGRTTNSSRATFNPSFVSRSRRMKFSMTMR